MCSQSHEGSHHLRFAVLQLGGDALHGVVQLVWVLDFGRLLQHLVQLPKQLLATRLLLHLRPLASLSHAAWLRGAARTLLTGFSASQQGRSCLSARPAAR